MELTLSSPTHVAVQSGNWSDPQTWNTGILPMHGAKVLIPGEISIKYDLESDSRLKTVDIAGELHFEVNRNTSMLVDTINLLSSGTLTLGTESAPIPSDYQARVIFAPVDPNERGIDKISDPLQLGRGLITQYGSTLNIEGAKKTSYLTLANGASRSSDTLEFDTQIPSDWRIGDKIVITATSRLGEEDVLEITEIQNNKIKFIRHTTGTKELANDYLTPHIDIAKVYVANLTRNIIFETEAGVDAPIDERGHIMLMDNANINNAAFIGLGRTNKDVIINNPVIDASGNLDPSSGTNPAGRYVIHVHEIKANHPEDTGISNLSGNAVWGSPGWGIAVHSSNANVSDNVVYDVLGAHYVTEVGDELVDFTNNIAIKASGSVTDKDADLIAPIDPRGKIRDFGSSGIGFWLASYSAKSFQNNIATGMADAGIIVYGQIGAVASPDVPTESLPAELQFIAGGQSTVASGKVPLRNFQNNTVYNSSVALELRGLSRDDTGFDVNTPSVGHTEPSIIENIHAWNIRESGIQISYASHIKIKDSSIYGNLEQPISRALRISEPRGVGVYSDKNARSIVYDNIRVEGFDIGITIPQTSEHGYNDEIKASVSQLIGGYFANNTYDWYPAPGRIDNPSNSAQLNPLTDQGPITPYFLVSEQPNLTSRINMDGSPPIASFTMQGVGGLSVLFDASTSYDPDYHLSWSDSSNGPYTAGDNTIAAFSWDFNSDGVVDNFGRYAIHKFEIPGQQSVTLTVMDLDGVTSTKTFEILVEEESSVSNRIINSDFSSSLLQGFGSVRWFESGQNISTSPNSSRGNWYTTRSSVWVFDPGNQQVKTKKGGSQGLIQVVEDNGILTGLKSISFDAINQEVKGDLRLEVFGVKGRFHISNWGKTAPRNINFSLPFEQKLIFDSSNIAEQTFSWSNFRWDGVDFGNGYQYVVLRFTSTGASTGNLQAVDNVYVGDIKNPSSQVTVQKVEFTGTTGNDTLNGITGADILIGLAGNDTYTVNNSGDVVVENFNEGTDTVQSDITYTLPDNVENLTINGSSNLNGTGNELANTLTGNTGNNILTGLDGNDRLDGKAGDDTLIGGLGDDTYTVDNIGDVVTENFNEGTDAVTASIDYTLGVNLENLTLSGSANISGTGNELNNTLTGNTGNNILNGGAGTDTLTGRGGADTFVFRFGESTVTALDRVSDFAIGTDTIDLLTQGGAAMNAPIAFSRAADSTTTILNTIVTNVFADANGAVAGSQALGINEAVLVKARTATYLVINDGTAGFQDANDLVVNLTGITGTLPALGAIPVISFFA